MQVRVVVRSGRSNNPMRQRTSKMVCMCMRRVCGQRSSLIWFVESLNPSTDELSHLTERDDAALTTSRPTAGCGVPSILTCCDTAGHIHIRRTIDDLAPLQTSWWRRSAGGGYASICG